MMKSTKATLTFFLTAAVLLIGNPRPAHAYLDPGSGSMITQALLAGVAGVSILTKVLWLRIKARFKRPSNPAE